VIRLIACGNPDAGDDAIGLVVAGAVRDRLEASPYPVEVLEVGPAIDAVPLLEDAGAAILLDAVRTRGGREPGEIVRVEAGPNGLPVELGAPVSSHGFGIGEAIAVARALGSTVPIVVIGVEAGDAALGRGLSPAVAAAAPRVVDLVLGEVLGLDRAAAR
jgi:hydrogenase maturation protease